MNRLIFNFCLYRKQSKLFVRILQTYYIVHSVINLSELQMQFTISYGLRSTYKHVDLGKKRIFYDLLEIFFKLFLLGTD